VELRAAPRGGRGDSGDPAADARLPRAVGGVAGYVMPGSLVHAYEEATRLEHERRYDEALESYYAGLKDDPLNMVLRLRVAQLHERLGLFLDALRPIRGSARQAGRSAFDGPD
jgi:hypothetical protein